MTQTDTRYLAAAFFVPNERTPGTMEALLPQIGATDIAPVQASEPGGQWWCSWAGMTCRATRSELPYHTLLVVRFFASAFLELLAAEDEEAADAPAAMQLAEVFRDACLRLQPDVAFLATHAWQASQQAILDREWMVLALEANGLADERFGLLYLSPAVSAHWSPSPHRDNRDSLPLLAGRLVFAGRGARRWF